MLRLFVTIACLTWLAADGRRPQDAAPQKDRHIADLEQQIAGREQLPAEQVFRNIQTFKGMPAIRVLRIMEQAFVSNLGVTCTLPRRAAVGVGREAGEGHRAQHVGHARRMAAGGAQGLRQSGRGRHLLHLPQRPGETGLRAGRVRAVAIPHQTLTSCSLNFSRKGTRVPRHRSSGCLE